MPSGSMVQMNVTAGDRVGRVGAAAHSGGGGSSGSSGSNIRPSSQAHGLSVGSSGGGQREAPATSRNGGRGGGREGGAYTSLEQSGLALKSSGDAIDVEVSRWDMWGGTTKGGQNPESCLLRLS